MSGFEKCQEISDTPGVKNQLIHKLGALPRVRLPAPGQRISQSSLQVGSGGQGGDGVNIPPLLTDHPSGQQNLKGKDRGKARCSGIRAGPTLPLRGGG